MPTVHECSARPIKGRGKVIACSSPRTASVSEEIVGAIERAAA